MNKITVLLIGCMISCSISAQVYQPTPENLQARNSFQDMKFGMFIHWGASSVLGSGEWVMNNRNIKTTEYQHNFGVFK